MKGGYLVSLFLSCTLYISAVADTGLGFEAAKLRGLSYKKIPSKKLTQKQAASYVLRLLDKELEPDPTLCKEIFLKQLGLMPKNSSIREILGKLYANQIRGLYDPEKKIFIVVDGVDDQSASAVAAAMSGLDATEIYTIHELEHAIQDQHFDLSAISKSVKNDSDRAFAVQSLIEGDASLVMMNFTLAKLGMDEAAVDLSGGIGTEYSTEDLKELGLEDYLTEQSEQPVFNDSAIAGAPLYFQELLTVPYNQGMVFVQAVKKNGGWSRVNKAFKSLPVSSEQIYHPEKYLRAKDRPKKVPLGQVKKQVGAYRLGAAL